MDNLTALPNIGPVLAKHLQDIGVETPEQLREMGATEAFLRIRMGVDTGACLHQLQALEAAVEGVRKSQLSQETKNELATFFQSVKG